MDPIRLKNKELQRLYTETRGGTDRRSRRIRNLWVARQLEVLLEPGVWV